MSLIDDFDLVNARMDAEDGMVDVCEIRRAATRSDGVDDNGKHTFTPGALIYPEPGRRVGVCKRQSPPGVRAELDVTSGDQRTTLSRSQVQIPSGAPAIPEGAIVTMLACPYEPTSVGRHFSVDGPAGKSMGTAQRLNVTEVIE